MPANAAIVITDGQTPPVSHTYTPVLIAGGVARWEDRAIGIAVGNPIMTQSVKRPVPKGARTYKPVVRLTVPVLEVSAPGSATGFQPAPARAFDNLGNVEFVFHERSTRQQRLDLLELMISTLKNDVTRAAVVDLEGVY